MSKDYYAVLGVLPTAEEVVIKAAYRALAQIYHPDRYSGSVEFAHQRMSEINEAYGVLSDPITRAEYNKTREREDKSNFTDDTSSAGESEDLEKGLKSDWEIACLYFPDLVGIFDGLKKTAIRLAVTFEAIVLSTKNFDERFEIASKLELLFLQTYFGTSPLVITFAKRLIKDANKPALQALNNAVRVLGSGANSNVIIASISKRYCFPLAKTPLFFDEAQIRFAQNYWLEFRRAVMDGKIEVVKSMLRSDPALLVVSNSDGNKALILAALEQQYEVFCYLLEVGGDPHAENTSGSTVVTVCTVPGREKYQDALMCYGYFC